MDKKKFVNEMVYRGDIYRVESFLVTRQEIPEGEGQLQEWSRQWKEQNVGKFVGEPKFGYHCSFPDYAYVCAVIYQVA